jgi:hypothetical protein
MKQKTYCAIIGDINRSRSLSGRAKVQRRFASGVETINREFKNAIASRFLVTLGDEFQGLLRTPDESYSLVRRFQEVMDPVPFTFGVGIGSLSTPLRPEALGMDGEAFHRAREALREAKRRRRTLHYSFDGENEPVVNALVAVMDLAWLRLTPRQRQIVRFLKEHTQKEVARRLRISVQSISRSKHAAGVVALEEASAALRRLLFHRVQP